MKNRTLFLTVVVCLLAAIIQTSAQKRVTGISIEIPPPANPLPIRRVTLYSNGMVYIERRGKVSGNAEVNLSFKQSQVDDVLKSMFVLDLGEGRIGAVSYNSSVTAGSRTAEIPFNIEAATEDNSGGLAGVLGQLQGARVLIATDKGTSTGAVLNVEKKQKTVKSKDGETLFPLNYALVIVSESGEISSFDLENIRSVKLLDEDTKRDVNEFASATASARRRDSKTINVVSEGTGERELVVSYTVSAPIWKTSYRVVLDEKGTPFFQGWAIIDNVSEDDWKNINLSLVSGSPISFIQPLQNPLYRHRPVIDIPSDLNLEPQVYDPAASTVDNVSSSGTGRGSGNGYGGGNGSVSNSVSVSSVEPVKIETSVSELLSSENSGVRTAAKGSEFGDLFEYKIEHPVTVMRNRSALIPIVQTKMEGERVSIYDEFVKNDRPMSGIMLKNTSNLTLEGGAMTILDHDSYAGEALMERLKPKEKRLISFAVDLGTLISVKDDESREPAKLVKAVDGVFQIHYFKQARKIYNLTNQTDRIKIIYLEHPLREKWILSDDSPKPVETTQSKYRFRFELQPFENKTFTITEKEPLMDSYRIGSLTDNDLELFLKSHYIDEATKLRLAGLIEIRAQIAAIDEKLKALDLEEKDIGGDQSRLRENIEALTKTPEAKQLITRYISKANDQESRIEAITKERQSLKETRAAIEAKLTVEIRNFEIK